MHASRQVTSPHAPVPVQDTLHVVSAPQVMSPHALSPLHETVQDHPTAHEKLPQAEPGPQTTSQVLAVESQVVHPGGHSTTTQYPLMHCRFSPGKFVVHCVVAVHASCSDGRSVVHAIASTEVQIATSAPRITGTSGSVPA